MPYAITPGGVRLYYQVTGQGSPLLFVHEFAGDFRSWEPQVRFFSRRYRCITFNARGYPPSDVPDHPDDYSQDLARGDILTLLDELDLDRAHIVGCSMGAFATIHLGLRAPQRCLSLTAAGVGYGALTSVQEAFRVQALSLADDIDAHGMIPFTARYAIDSPGRDTLLRKDPRGHAEFSRLLAEHSPQGLAGTMRGVQARRSAFDDLETELCALQIPLLVIAGDEDEPSLDASLFLKRSVPSAALAVLPKTGHAMNLEEPAHFNALLAEFIVTVEADAWQDRSLPKPGDRIL